MSKFREISINRLRNGQLHHRIDHLIQAKTRDFSARICGITTEFVALIPQSHVLKSTMSHFVGLRLLKERGVQLCVLYNKRKKLFQF